MDWFKSILHSLPLEAISDILGEIAIWWGQLVKDVPAADLPMYAYLGGVIIVLILWLLVARVLPRPLGGMSWMMLFAVLLAPGTALGDPSVIAPASISVVYAIMMKDTAGAIANMLPILVVLVVGLFVGFVWQLIRGAFESSLDKARSRTAEDTQATMQLTTGNYLTDNASLAESSDDSVLMSKSEITKPEMAKTEINKPEAEVSLKKDNKPLKQADSNKSNKL
ncbi:hypothetical protein QJS82_07560 [Psychrobacter maritimus]|uniref:hypothetical protein n=2 Tax=Psychrobacter TaxID=497 RepID=UPI00248B210C|nr:hypothetical protein [Psychrobacter sp. WB2]WGV12075.1 hypothetical protein QJS82_07560 [Psychrobacter sp. WB2]